MTICPMHITSLVPREVMEFYYNIVPTSAGKQFAVKTNLTHDAKILEILKAHVTDNLNGVSKLRYFHFCSTFKKINFFDFFCQNHKFKSIYYWIFLVKNRKFHLNHNFRLIFLDFSCQNCKFKSI